MWRAAGVRGDQASHRGNVHRPDTARARPQSEPADSRVHRGGVRSHRAAVRPRPRVAGDTSRSRTRTQERPQLGDAQPSAGADSRDCAARALAVADRRGGSLRAHAAETDGTGRRPAAGERADPARGTSRQRSAWHLRYHRAARPDVSRADSTHARHSGRAAGEHGQHHADGPDLQWRRHDPAAVG